MRTIPDELLSRIASAWPHLGAIVENIRLRSDQAETLERHLINNVPAMSALTVFSTTEWLNLCRCAAGEPYGAHGEWLTVADAAERLGYGRTTIYRALAARGIETIERGRRRWMREADVAGIAKRARGRPKKTGAQG